MTDLSVPRLSKSALVKYRKCPKDFYYDYILNFRKNRPDPPEDSPLTIGTELHQIFEDYYKLPESRELEGVDYEQEILDILMEMPDAQKYPDHMKNFASFNKCHILGDEKKGIKAKGMDYAPLETESSY